jgi:hypothetical protein
MRLHMGVAFKAVLVVATTVDHANEHSVMQKVPQSAQGDIAALRKFSTRAQPSPICDTLQQERVRHILKRQDCDRPLFGLRRTLEDNIDGRKC